MTARKKKIVNEDTIHRLIVVWLKEALPPDAILHHSPNEGKRHVNFKAKLKRLGCKWGWPDIEIFVPLRYWRAETQPAGLFLEVKSAAGKVSIEQAARHVELLAAGQHVAVVKNLGQVRNFLHPLIALREDAAKAKIAWAIAEATQDAA
jgi:hypothetical protein